MWTYLPQFLIVLGGILTIIGGVWIYYQQNEFQEEVIGNTKEVIDNTNDNLNMLTGGESYPIFGYAHLKMRDHINNTVTKEYIRVLFTISGDYPLISTSFKHIDWTYRSDEKEYLKKEKLREMDERNQFNEVSKLGEQKNYSPRTVHHMENRDLPQPYLPPNGQESPSLEKQVYRVTTTSLNGTFFQETTLSKDKNGDWLTTHDSIVIKYIGKEKEIFTRNGTLASDYIELKRTENKRHDK